MDCVAPGVGKIIRRKMSKRRMIQTYLSGSYNECLWFGYTSAEEKLSVFTQVAVSVRVVVPYAQ